MRPVPIELSPGVGLFPELENCGRRYGGVGRWRLYPTHPGLESRLRTSVSDVMDRYTCTHSMALVEAWR